MSEEAPEPTKIALPPLDKGVTALYDNDRGAYWLGLPLTADPFELVLMLDRAKHDLMMAHLDFKRRQSVAGKILRVGGQAKEAMGAMMTRLAGKT